MPKVKHIIVKGVEYAVKPGRGCDGCAGMGEPSVCASLPECLPGRRSYIFVVVKDRAALRGTVLTGKQIKAYMKDTSKCPRCCSTSIEGEGVEIETGGATQAVQCLECGLLWRDAYVHKGFTYQDDVEGDLE